MPIIKLPYVSQRDGPGAGDFANDCGPASLAMFIYGAKVQRPTVSDIYRATGVVGDKYINGGQLIRAGNKWAIPLYGKYFSMDSMKAMMDAGHPIIALVHYGTFSSLGKTESSFKGPHFLNIVGYENSDVIVHDPLWRGEGGKYLRWPESVFYRAWEESRLDGNPKFWGLTTHLMYPHADDVDTKPSVPVPQDPDAWGVAIVGGSLNVSVLRLRHHPPNGPTIAYMKAGTLVDVLEDQKNGWWHIRYGEIEGWAGGGGLTVIPKPPAEPEPPDPPQTAKVFLDMPDAEKWKIVQGALIEMGVVGVDGTVLE